MSTAEGRRCHRGLAQCQTCRVSSSGFNGQVVYGFILYLRYVTGCMIEFRLLPAKRELRSVSLVNPLSVFTVENMVGRRRGELPTRVNGRVWRVVPRFCGDAFK